MCGRYKLDLDWTEIVRLYRLDPDATFDAYTPRYNVAPTQRMPILVGAQDATGLRRLVRPAHWGLLAPWSARKDAARAINARSETVVSSRMFADAFRRRRCLVPNTGFYEWRKEGTHKVPTLLRPRDARALAFAGLWQAWQDPATGERFDTYTVLTCGPNALLAPIHDRMPVTLPEEAWDTWLAGPAADAEAWMRPADEGVFEARVVGPRVGNVRNDDPACAEPVDEPT